MNYESQKSKSRRNVGRDIKKVEKHWSIRWRPFSRNCVATMHSSSLTLLSSTKIFTIIPRTEVHCTKGHSLIFASCRRTSVSQCWTFVS